MARTRTVRVVGSMRLSTLAMRAVEHAIGIGGGARDDLDALRHARDLRFRHVEVELDLGDDRPACRSDRRGARTGRGWPCASRRRRRTAREWCGRRCASRRRSDARSRGVGGGAHGVEPRLRGKAAIEEFLIRGAALPAPRRWRRAPRPDRRPARRSTSPPALGRARTRSPLSKRKRRMVSATFGVSTMLSRAWAVPSAWMAVREGVHASAERPAHWPRRRPASARRHGWRLGRSCGGALPPHGAKQRLADDDKRHQRQPHGDHRRKAIALEQPQTSVAVPTAKVFADLCRLRRLIVAAVAINRQVGPKSQHKRRLCAPSSTRARTPSWTPTLSGTAPGELGLDGLLRLPRGHP